MADKDKYSEIFGSTSKYSLLRILLFSISYIFYILITRLLGPAEFGKLALVIQLGTEIGTILIIGLPMTLTRFIPRLKGREEQSKLFSQSIYVGSVSISVSAAEVGMLLLEQPYFGSISNFRFPFCKFISWLCLCKV